MSIIFKGNDAWEPVEIPKWGIDGWGTDRCTIAWRGSREKREAFMATLDHLKWSTLPSFGTNWPGNRFMFLESWGEGGGTYSFPGLDLQFIGLRSGIVPPGQSTDSTSLQTAQGSGTNTATGKKVSGSFSYRASRTSWKWLETAKPPAIPRPPYGTVNYPINPFTTLYQSSITDDDTGKSSNIPYASFVAVFNSLSASVRVSDYQREEVVPGRLWRCSTEVDYALS